MFYWNMFLTGFMKVDFLEKVNFLEKKYSRSEEYGFYKC